MRVLQVTVAAALVILQVNAHLNVTSDALLAFNKRQSTAPAEVPSASSSAPTVVATASSSAPAAVPTASSSAPAEVTVSESLSVAPVDATSSAAPTPIYGSVAPSGSASVGESSAPTQNQSVGSNAPSGSAASGTPTGSGAALAEQSGELSPPNGALGTGVSVAQIVGAGALAALGAVIM
ncbi:hypothetical protein C2E23DRAFT_889719 [Lenzites betulinus]|nr:hypothetical protein C2E23DRAFT_889719 [Lenzites betulinus]